MSEAASQSTSLLKPSGIQTPAEAKDVAINFSLEDLQTDEQRRVLERNARAQRVVGEKHRRPARL